MEQNEKKGNELNKFLNGFKSRFKGYLGFKTTEVMGNKRSFNVAKASRINTGNLYSVSSTDINSDIFSDGSALLKVVREFEKNNPYVRKFLNIMVTGTVGSTGFNLYVKGYDIKPETINSKRVFTQIIDGEGNKAVLSGFWDWAKKQNCDLTQTHSLTEIEELAVRQLMRDGESLIVKHKGGKELNKYGYALQIINIERLDRQYTGVTAVNGNRIVMGIELDKNNRRVAYYLKKYIVTAVPGVNQKLNGSQYERINSEDCIYLFKATDAEQLRGYSPMVAGLETLEQLEGYQEAELVNARASAAKMGFFVSNGVDVNQLDIADRQDEQGNFISEVEPGTFHVLPQGYDYKENNPNYPQTFDKFCKTVLRTVSSAFNISYESLANDREGVSFSSIRAGTIENNEIFKALQNFIIENMLDNIYEDWLKSALLNKAIKLPDGSIIPFEKYDKFKNHMWRGRGFPWVDPLKDISASVEAVKFGLSSRQRECEKLGIDLYEIFDELAEEQRIAKEKDLHLDNAENVMAKLQAVNNFNTQ